MEYYTVLGLMFAALIAIFGFFVSIKKTIKDEHKPIEELNLNIVRLNANFDNMMRSDEIRDTRITKHGKEIDRIVETQRQNEKTLSNHELRLSNLEKEVK